MHTPSPAFSAAPPANATHTGNTATNPASVAVLVGRWQIFHKGHETLLQAALAAAPSVIVVIGSALRARDARNPFNWQERAAMVRATLSPAQQERVAFLPIRDYYNDTFWNAAVAQGVHHLAGAQREIVLVGFKKDHTSYYLDNFPHWRYCAVEYSIDINATALRNVYFDSPAAQPEQAAQAAQDAQDAQAADAVLAPHLSAGVLAYLRAWRHLPAFASQAQEHRAVSDYRKRWTASAYLTADTVVRAADHVLLIRRGGDIGHGLWALPGGFIDPHESFYAAAVRELAEETGLKPLASTLSAALQGSKTFDHPLRSPRGRIVTQAFYFNLGHIRLPEVAAADDAMQAQWIPIAELATLQEQFFEDHATILDSFLGPLI